MAALHASTSSALASHSTQRLASAIDHAKLRSAEFEFELFGI